MEAELLRLVKVPLIDYANGEDARNLLGVGISKAYQLARSGELPTIRLGGRYWVTTATLRKMLGIEAA